VLKFFLNVSRDEQKRRFMERLDDPGKNWKFSSADVARTRLLGRIPSAYEDAIRATARSTHPGTWCCDNKWYMRLVVVAASSRRWKSGNSPTQGRQERNASSPVRVPNWSRSADGSRPGRNRAIDTRALK